MSPAKPELKRRIEFTQVAPEGIKALKGLAAYVHHHSGLEPRMLQLVWLRASQMNGCAYCIDMHTKDARAAGETEQRIYGLSAWEETPFYTDRERAALAWTETITAIYDNHVPDEAYEAARRQFNEKELVDLTLAVIEINSWNRLAITFRSVPGSYQVQAKK